MNVIEPHATLAKPEDVKHFGKPCLANVRRLRGKRNASDACGLW
jgi:hypothetical protein